MYLKSDTAQTSPQVVLTESPQWQCCPVQSFGLCHPGAQPGGRLEKACRLQTLRWHATGEKFNSRDTTAHGHCGMHGEVGIARAVHLRAWEKRHAVEGTGNRLVTSHRELAPGESKF